MTTHLTAPPWKANTGPPAARTTHNLPCPRRP